MGAHHHPRKPMQPWLKFFILLAVINGLVWTLGVILHG